MIFKNNCIYALNNYGYYFFLQRKKNFLITLLFWLICKYLSINDQMGKGHFFVCVFLSLFLFFIKYIYIVISWNCLDSERVWYSKIFIKNILRMKRIHSLDFSLHSKIEFLKHVCVLFVLFNSQFFFSKS